MTEHSPSSPAARFTGRHMFALVVGFFAVIVAVNIWLAVVSARSWTGLVVQNSYVASQHFNDELARARQQERLGWTPSLRIENGEILFELSGADGRNLFPQTVELHIGRPAFEQADRDVSLVHRGRGLYSSSLGLPDGIWQYRVQARVDGVNFRHDGRVLVKAGRGTRK